MELVHRDLPEPSKLFPEPLLYLYMEAKGESVTEKVVTFQR
jgi:hypothetical protein